MAVSNIGNFSSAIAVGCQRDTARDRRWLAAFAAETAGWLTCVAALRLAPLALVQAVTASGVAVLAFAAAGTCPGWPGASRPPSCWRWPG